MTPSIVVALAALLPHADKATRLKIVLCIVVIITQENCLKRVLAAVPKPFRRGILSSFLMRKAYQAPRSTPSEINRPSVSPIKAMIDGGHETEFRRMFRLSRNVFEALVQDLSPWIKDGRSRNGRQNVEARVKVGIALFYMAHGGDGISLGAISGLKNNSALKYLHEVSAAITIHIAPKWMGPELLNSPGYADPETAVASVHASSSNACTSRAAPLRQCCSAAGHMSAILHAGRVRGERGARYLPARPPRGEGAEERDYPSRGERERLPARGGRGRAQLPRAGRASETPPPGEVTPPRPARGERGKWR